MYDGQGMLFIPDSLVPAGTSIDALLASAGITEREDAPRK